MKWSHSGARTFILCPRKWYYQTYYAHSNAKDPNRQEAVRLKRLVNIRAWRGRVVDEVISKNIIPRLNRGTSPTLLQIRSMADDLVRRDLAGINLRGSFYESHPTTPNSGVAFYETEYGLGPEPTELEKAINDIHTALGTFSESNVFKDLCNTADYVIAQRPLSFTYGGYSVRAVPDVLAFYRHRPPAIIDWKVQEPRYTQNAYQLILYGLALERAKPHNDFPDFTRGKLSDVSRFRLVESQLLRQEEILHRAEKDDIREMEDYIFTTGEQMASLFNGRPTGEFLPETFPTARKPGICTFCNFKKICWKKDLI